MNWLWFQWKDITIYLTRDPEAGGSKTLGQKLESPRQPKFEFLGEARKQEALYQKPRSAVSLHQ